MFTPKIKFDKALWERIERAAEGSGYATPEEFVHHVVEMELRRLDAAAGGGDSDGADGPGDDDEVAKQLRGLGYIE